MTDQRRDRPMPPPPPGTPAFHPRGTLVAGGLGGALQRATWVSGIVSILVTLILVTALGDRYSVVLAPVVAVLATVVGVGLAFLTMPSRSRRAFETFAWLGRREINRFRERTGSNVPTDPGSVEQWLRDNPRSPATAFPRLELLAMLGRTDEAFAEQALMPPPGTDAEAVEHALARRFTAFIATGQPEESELDALEARLPRDSDAALELAVARAIGEARVRRAAGRDDWRDPMLAVRPRLGRDATMTMVRDVWWKLALTELLLALGIALILALWR
ncbi:MAG TPA: hypothetical protein VKB30_00750 [Candidatus Limnocylindrales bacterium]|nr:hypothetical protein [Candidatus Limnocylindrales bacterium]